MTREQYQEKLQKILSAVPYGPLDEGRLSIGPQAISIDITP